MKKIYLLLFLVISFSCQKEEMVSPVTQEQDIVAAIKAEFSLSEFPDEYIKNNLRINWNEYWVNDNDESFSFTTSLNSQLNGGNKSLFYKYHLVVFQMEGNWKFTTITF
jgi:hypothetical protein